MRGTSSGAMPIPLSVTHSMAKSPSRSTATVDLAAVGRVLGRVGDEVGDHLREARGIGAHVQRHGRQRDREVMVALLDLRAHRVERIAHDLADIERLEAQARSSRS
jgi:hypothetical protein